MLFQRCFVLHKNVSSSTLNQRWGGGGGGGGLHKNMNCAFPLKFSLLLKEVTIIISNLVLQKTSIKMYMC